MENNAVFAAALTKYYGKSRGIDGLDLAVEKGAFFGFIGPNGAGKSTTIRTLLGLISPDSGTGRVLGLDIVKDKRSILERVGYLPSDNAFYAGMRVRDMLKLSRSCAAGSSWIPKRRLRIFPSATGKRSASSAPCSTIRSS